MTSKRAKSIDKTQTGPKRAAIYVRVSSEAQAERVSPEAQENDCRVLCERQGYSIIDVYRDTEKYRVGKRLVEPSGTRADRPHFRQMLADADAGRFDVNVAWREDRLYRGVNRAMLEVSERVQARIAELQARAAATAVDCSKLERDLNDLAMQRQWVITQTRLKNITQGDMDTQLAALSWQEASSRYELSQAQLLSDDRVSRLIAMAENFHQEVT